MSVRPTKTTNTTQTHFPIKNLPECSETFGNVPKCSSMVRNIRKCSKMFRNVPECSKMFQNTPKWSELLPKSLVDQKFEKNIFIQISLLYQAFNQKLLIHTVHAKLHMIHLSILKFYMDLYVHLKPFAKYNNNKNIQEITFIQQYYASKLRDFLLSINDFFYLQIFQLICCSVLILQM